MLRQHDYTTKVKIRGSKQPTEDELRIAAEKEERRDRLEQAAERAKSQSRPRRQIELVGARAYPPEPPVELEPVPLPETSGLLQSSLGGAAYREE